MTRADLLADARLCPSRRSFIVGAGALVAWANMPRHAFAGTVRDPRFVAIVLRGAMDGLAVVPPVGDPGYAALRGDLAVGADGRGVLPLDGTFALNDAMPRLAELYRSREMAVVHACATAYRDRSHFDGQDVLETGMAGPRAADDGWLNRVAAALPEGEKVRPAQGLAIGPTVPLILRGAAPTLTWSPPSFKPAGSDTVMRLAALYGELDPTMAKVLQEGITTDELAAGGMVAGPGNLARGFRSLAEGAGRLLSEDDGPRLAAISYDGWDTHANEGAEEGRLANLLKALDGALDGLKSSLGDAWGETVAVVMTEFGRTARANGNEGTDHGTATATFVLGGAVNGGRVVADWPGLKEADLYENRDLYPTTDMRAVLKGLLRDHLGLSDRALSTRIFPGSLAVKSMDGLVNA
ncbi:DUF1501 domain-containing protein [Consotaella salsifontis]|uniref:Uncharacterized conserved protein, DUF1501 family n=1 Tax=Consotaella salsifontis TaxID=1365950 RepID=A0A1T4QUH0_9HYPH|nr:DUF1501 domain-containing protein [Consotaella salsifontis]SKA07247.1 Uncharacterized conserved protein, DUF1501 family [Consotaella salsifontis]